MHYPTHSRAREIVDDPAAGFGSVLSVSVRYPLHVPSKGGLPMSDRTVHSCVGRSGLPPSTRPATAVKLWLCSKRSILCPTC